MNTQERIRKIRDLMLGELVEREVPIRLALLAALSGEHLLLVGPPGTAKSLVSRRLQLAFADAPYFERLLTRFTVPEELFGPLSVKALENDRYERLTARYLPTASIAFLDEIFKANSAILNALLTLLNEREFDNGTERMKVPLIAVVGASNELPKEKEQEALFDRFLLRLHVGSVSKEGFDQLLTLRGQPTPTIPAELKLTRNDLEAVQLAAEKTVLPPEIVNLLGQLREFCLVNKLPVSDRRWRKVVKLLQTSAHTNGRDAVNIWDCWLLQHCLWNTPDDRKKIYDWYAERVGASEEIDPKELLEVVVTWEGALAVDKAARSQKVDEQGRLLYTSAHGNLVTANRGDVQMLRNGEPLFTASKAIQGNHYNRLDPTNQGNGYTRKELMKENNFAALTPDQKTTYFNDPENWMMTPGNLAPAVETTRHKPSYIKDCLSELNGELAKLSDFGDELCGHVKDLDEQIRTHLWVTSEFLTPALSSLNATLEKVTGLHNRLKKVVEGYESLPQGKKVGAKV